MARITVEDCLEHINNRFDLVLSATQRARLLEKNEAEAMVAIDDDKPTVVALREIAQGFDVTAKPKSIEMALPESEAAE